MSQASLLVLRLVFVSVYFVVISTFVFDTSAADYWERLVSEITCYLLNKY